MLCFAYTVPRQQSVLDTQFTSSCTMYQILTTVQALYTHKTTIFHKYQIVDLRQRGRFAGFSLYVSRTGVFSSDDMKDSILCYKNGPKLPTLNFTTKCIEYGNHVIFYNERHDHVIYPEKYEIENVFTELCEVIVRGM